MSWEIQPQQIAQRDFIEWMFATKSVTGLVSWGEAHQVGGAETQEGCLRSEHSWGDQRKPSRRWRGSVKAFQSDIEPEERESQTDPNGDFG